MIVFLSIVGWILAILLLVLFVLLVIWMTTAYKSKAPFVSVPNSILPDIKKALDIREGNKVYHLGCGDGKVLFYLARCVSNADYTGIENSPFPFIMARSNAWWNRILKLRQIKLVNQDFFKSNLSEATHIFCYLYPDTMDDLLSKFEAELKPGTRLVSISFKFTTKQPIAEIDLQRSAYKLGRKIYIYEF